MNKAIIQGSAGKRIGDLFEEGNGLKVVKVN